MFEEDQSWFQHLKTLGESQGFLTYAQVNNWLPTAIVDPLNIEEIVDRLNRFGIKVVPSRDEL
jgi:RNA polymerase primary sigma factor